MKSDNNIKVPVWLATVIVAGGFTWLGWISNEIIQLGKDVSVSKNDIATIKETITTRITEK